MLDRAPKFFAKYDKLTGKPLRDDHGRCVPADRGEPGVLLGAFQPLQTPGRMYHGGDEVNEAKLERNVVKKDDLYFNFGDLLYMDKEYFMYFSDRMGETFRWQGENVSTQEVSNVLSKVDFVMDACVYGVTIPGHDGRAGMALLTLTSGKSDVTDTALKAIYDECQRSLPKYAHPKFLRVQAEMPMTSTYKQHKVKVIKEGFNPNVIPQSLYYINQQSLTYRRLDAHVYGDIITGGIRL